MVDLPSPSSSMLLAGYSSSGRELNWLLSVFTGIVMCKFVFNLTGVISLLFIEGYTKLNGAEKLEWKNRGCSTFHALVVSAASFYLLVLSDLFDEHSRDELIINRRSTLSDTILGISIGYFLSDLVMILWHFPTLGGMEFVLHHGLSLLSIVLSLLSGQGQVYILMVLFSESTTPFVNLRWQLDVAGLKNTILYMCNGAALFLGWLVARILLFVVFFHHLLTHFDQVKEEVFPFGFYSLLVVPIMLATMNLIWFSKIAKGLIKTLSKPRFD